MHVSLLFTVNWFFMTKTKVISTGTEKQLTSEAQQQGRNFFKPESITYAACSSTLFSVWSFQIAYIISSDRIHE